MMEFKKIQPETEEERQEHRAGGFWIWIGSLKSQNYMGLIDKDNRLVRVCNRECIQGRGGGMFLRNVPAKKLEDGGYPKIGDILTDEGFITDLIAKDL